LVSNELVVTDSGFLDPDAETCPRAGLLQFTHLLNTNTKVLLAGETESTSELQTIQRPKTQGQTEELEETVGNTIHERGRDDWTQVKHIRVGQTITKTGSKTTMRHAREVISK